MSLHFIDSHAHVTSDAPFSTADELLKRAQEAGLTAIVNICTDPLSVQRGIELRQKYPWFHLVACTPPNDVQQFGEKHFDFFVKAAHDGHFKAIGETGLDYHYDYSPKALQQEYLIKYLHLAIETNLPVVIHCRDAFEDFFTIIDREYLNRPGILHCFTGTMREAQQVIERNWYLSLSGIVTFKKSLELQEVAKWVPLENLLIETDTPYLAPQSKRGKMNEPAYLPEVAQMVARLKGISVEEVASVTAQNACKVFKL